MDGNGMLSQEEINALFSDNSDNTEAQAASDVEEKVGKELKEGRIGDILTDIEKDAIGEISNISMGTAATTLNTLVSQPVSITTPKVSYGVWEDLASDFNTRPFVALQLGYKEGLNGENILILRERDVMIITDLMMGGDGTNISGELGEMQLSAISEAMNQMMGSSSTSLSSMINRKIDILPPVARIISFNDTVDFEASASFIMGEFVKVSFKMTIGDLVDSEIMQLYPLDFAKKLYNMFSGGGAEENMAPKKNDAVLSSLSADTNTSSVQQPDMMNAGQIPPQMNEQQIPYPMYGQQMPYPPMNGQQMPYPMYGQMPYPPMNGQQMPYPQMYGQSAEQQNPVNAQVAQFQTFMGNVSPAQQKENIDLIMDVPLEVVVELGKTSRSIKDILEFAPGTVIELNKIAGEPVDVLVNGKYVAKGEVVVIEESFAIRITEIIK